jgi:serine/threonine-protein kinase
VPSLLGKVLHDTYRIESLLGRGGMGEVYLASHLRLPRRFAIKVLYAFGPAHSQEVTRFRREAEVVSALGHPHIVEVVDFNHTAEGAPYIVMELLEGEDLATRLKRSGRLSLARTGAILRQVASALQAAHQRGVIHRDLKPRNIYLCRRAGEDDWVKVLDFGLSKVEGAHTQVTNAMMAIGTPRYMSPEQALGHSSKADARSDIFAMGAILYRMLSGQLPFRGSNVQTVLYAIVHLEPPPLVESLPGISSRVAAVVERALCKDPRLRHPSMEELSRDFHEAAGLAVPDLRVVSEEDRLQHGPGRSRTGPPLLIDASSSGGGERRSPSGPHGPDGRGSSAPLTVVDRPGVEGTQQLSSTEIADDDGDEVGDDPRWVTAERRAPPADESRAPVEQSASYGSAQGEVLAPPLVALVTGETAERAGRRSRRQHVLALIASGVIVIALCGAGFWIALRFLGEPPLPTKPPTPTADAVALRRPRPPDASVDSAAVAAREADLAPAVRDFAVGAPAPDLGPRTPPPRRQRVSVRIVARRGGIISSDRIYVDGRLRGQSPITLTLPAGQHAITVKAEGFRTITRSVTLRAGPGTRILQLDLD